MKARTHQAATITATDIEALASKSRERALAARQAATELSAEQIAAVGGGALGAGNYYDRPFPRGVLPYLKMTDILTSPVDHMTVPTDIVSGKGF